MKDYPNDLPLPQRSNYDITPGAPTFQRTRLVTGRVFQRRTYPSVPVEVDVEFLCTQDQATTFEGFYKYEINSGADWFMVPLITPMGLKRYQARFTDDYDGPTLTGVLLWKFSATLELVERAVMGEDEYYFRDFVYNADILDVAINRLWPQP